jgi:curved DNA-binding protein CbpA
MVCASSLRVLGLSSNATKSEVKAAFRRLAKEWHPDKHQGRGKAQAEVRFKQIAEAYENLADGGGGGGGSGAEYADGMHGPGRHAQGSGTRRPGRERERAYETWGTREQYGPASRSGYDPFEGYMDFGPGTPAGEARARTEQRQRQRMRMSACFFLVGLGAITWSARNDNRRRDKGELVDAFYNNVSGCRRPRCLHARVSCPLLAPRTD